MVCIVQYTHGKSYILVGWPETRKIPETMVGRILMLMWSFGPRITSRIQIAEVGPIDALLALKQVFFNVWSTRAKGRRGTCCGFWIQAVSKAGPISTWLFRVIGRVLQPRFRAPLKGFGVDI